MAQDVEITLLQLTKLGKSTVQLR